MWLYILIYIVFTIVAIYYVENEGIFKSDRVLEFIIRMFFLLTIGWFFAICGTTGACLVWIALIGGEQTLGVQLDQREHFFAIPWACGFVKRFVKKLFIIKKKEVELCTNDSQIEQEKF